MNEMCRKKYIRLVQNMYHVCNGTCGDLEEGIRGQRDADQQTKKTRFIDINFGQVREPC